MLSSVIVESDSIELINILNGDIELWSPYSAIASDCFYLANQIEGIKFQHCPREANLVVHNLARSSLQLSSYFIWDGDPPNSVVIDALNDVTLLCG